MNIFFSYGHDKNRPIVDRLKADIEATGKHKVWIDKERLNDWTCPSYDSDWRSAITKGIMESDLFMSMASHHGLRPGGVCLDELQIAVCEKNAFIQTVLLEPEVYKLVPAAARHNQYKDLSEWTRSEFESQEFESWYESKLNEILGLLDSTKISQFNDELEEIKIWLNTSSTSTKRETLGKQTFVGREWLSQKVGDWIGSESPVLLIEGSPGCGKSAFTAHELICNRIAGAAIFCQWDDESSNNIEDIACSIAFQLAQRYDDYRAALIRVIRNEKDAARNGFRSRRGDSFRRYISNLASLLIDGERENLLIIIDGLDEVKSIDGTNPLAAGLRRAYGNSEIPRFIRFLITSRPDPKTKQELASIGCESIIIDEFEGRNKTDLEEYASTFFADKPEYHMAGQLVDRAKGNFLYLKLAFRSLDEGMRRIDELPETISGFYRDYLNRVFDDIDYDQYYEALCVLSSAGRSVPKDTLIKTLGWTLRDYWKFKNTFGMYLSEGAQGELEYFHKSFSEWICSDDAGVFQTDIEKGCKILSKGVLSAFDQGLNTMNDFEVIKLVSFAGSLYMNPKDTDRILASMELAERLEDISFKSKLIDSIKCTEEALRVYINLRFKNPQDTNIAIKYGYILLHLGALQMAVRDYANAASNFVKSLEICREMQKLKERAFMLLESYVLNNLALVKEKTGDIKEFEESIKTSIEILNVLSKDSPEKYTYDFAKSEGNLALYYYKTKRFEKARQLFLSSLEKFIKARAFALVDPKEDIARTKLNLMMASRECEDWDEAEKYALEATNEYESIFAEAPEIYSYDLAKAYAEAGFTFEDSTKSITYLNKALLLYKKPEEGNSFAHATDIARTYFYLGKVHWAEFIYAESKSCFMEAIAILENADTPKLDDDLEILSSACQNLAIIFDEELDTENAEDYYQRSLKALESLVNHAPEVYFRNFSNACLDLGLRSSHCRDKEAFYKRALGVYDTLTDELKETYLSDAADVHNALGIHYGMNGNYLDSKIFLSKALKIYEDLDAKTPGLYKVKINRAKYNLFALEEEFSDLS